MISRALRKCFSVNPLRSVVRSENQNITWSLEDLERHSDAFSAGIQELGLSKGDKLLTWFDDRHVTESLGAQFGCLKAGVTILPVQSEDPNDFFQALSDPSVKAAVISPNGRVQGNLKKSEVLQNRFSEMQQAHLGENVQLGDFPHVQFLVHTGFYSIPGMFKYKDVLLYANSNFLNFDLQQIDGQDELFEGVRLTEASDSAEVLGHQNEGRNLLVLGNINNPQLFAQGALTSYTSGNYSVVLTGEEDVLSVARLVPEPVVIHESAVDTQLLDGLRSIGVQDFVSV